MHRRGSRRISSDLRRVAIAAALTLAFLLGTFRAIAAPTTPSLVEQARSLGLGQSIGWTRLLHYRPGTLGGKTSEIEGKAFFLARDGKHDPEAELEATLAAFLAPVSEANDGEEDEHALCRFPARRAWLEARLHFEAGLRLPRCQAVARFVKKIDPESISIVYSAPYMGEAASAFGHTFLRVHKRRPPGSKVPSERLDFGVDFVAEPDTKNPVLYVYKGLAGLFPGVVQFHTYDEKVREYGGYEERDLWEYELALTPEELSLYTLHLFELTRTHIEFFYLRKNCSYTVLASVEAVAPRIDLLSRLNAVVVPKDTIRAIAGMPGLVRAVNYRPSMESNLRAHAARLTPREREIAERLARDPGAPMPGDSSAVERAAALDAAMLVLDARFGSTKPSGDENLAEERETLQTRRALLGDVPAPPPLPAPHDKAPQLAHGSMRFTLGTGATTQYGSDFLAVGYRLALHDLVDPPDGEPELSSVQILDAQLRYDVVRQSLTVDRLTFAEIVALNPLTGFEKPVSWKVKAFGMRLHDRACPDCFAHGLDGGVGETIATADQRVALFLMADAYVAFSGPALDGIGGSFVRVGLGPYGGLRVHLPGRTVALFTGGWSYLPGQTLRSTYDLRASVRCALSADIALGVEAASQPLSSEALVSSYLYF